MSETLVINEVYLSLQGESTFAGLPCVFIRLPACNLRCYYGDTAYAFTAGRKWTLGEVTSQVENLAQPFGTSGVPLGSELCRLALGELTGGETLLPPNAV